MRKVAKNTRFNYLLYEKKIIKPVLALLFLLLFFLLISSCTKQQVTQTITLIPTSLFDTQYNFLLIKDDYVRAFTSRDNSKNVKAIFRKGDILSVIENDPKIKQEAENIGFMWYKVQHEGVMLWLYAQNVMFCRSMSEALLFRARLN